MVKNFHAAGIEVILDVVYNHTAEGEADGPTYSFRGLDDRGYYKRAGPVGDAYWDVTGCGNTVDSTSQGALRLILDSLRYWATEMHVDGFRFDLASALARTGLAIDMRCAFLTTIGQDPVLRNVKLIAEPWDASMDGYLVGSFPPPWVEWNDSFRDTMRDFWRQPGDVAAARVAARRLVRPVRRRRPVAVRVGELRRRARRLHACATWSPTTHKHNEANGEQQPRRQRQQPLDQPRRRGRDRRPRHRRAPAAAGRQPDDHAVPVVRLADDQRGRRAGAHPARQQQRLRAGQRDLVGRLAAGRRVARRLRLHQDRAPAAARPPRAPAAAPLRRDARRSTAARRTSPGCTRRAARWRSRTGTTTRCTSSACSSPATRSAPPARTASSSATPRS